MILLWTKEKRSPLVVDSRITHSNTNIYLQTGRLILKERSTPPRNVERKCVSTSQLNPCMNLVKSPLHICFPAMTSGETSSIVYQMREQLARLFLCRGSRSSKAWETFGVAKHKDSSARSMLHRGLRLSLSLLPSNIIYSNDAYTFSTRCYLPNEVMRRRECDDSLEKE